MKKNRKKVLALILAAACVLSSTILPASAQQAPDAVSVSASLLSASPVETQHPPKDIRLHSKSAISFVGTTSQDYWDPAASVNGNTEDGLGWHTQDNVTDAWITFDLGSSKEISYFSALPRNPETNGDTFWDRFMGDFDLYVTDSTPDYTSTPSFSEEPVFSGAFVMEESTSWQGFTFTPVTGRYVTVHVKNSLGDGCINVREFDFGYPNDLIFDDTVDYSRDLEAAANHVPNAKDTVYEDKWGIFCHYLGYGCTPEEWDERMRDFNVEDYAAKLHEMGAGYVILTLQQGSENICRPLPNILKKEGNLNRNRLGIDCYGSERDLPADLYRALEPYGIDLYLYQATDFFTVHDEDGEDLTFKVIDDYMRDYKEKGVKISGWFFDGVGWNTYRMLPLRAAVSKHDPDCSITFNTGTMPNGNGEDFAQIEAYDFLNTAYHIPLGDNGIFENGEVSSVCTYLSQWYGCNGHDTGNPHLAPNLPGPRYTDKQLIDASVAYISAGGSVTYDVPVFYRTADHEDQDLTESGDIGFLNCYVEQLKKLGDALEPINREDGAVAPAERTMLNDTSSELHFSGDWSYHSYVGTNPPYDPVDPYNNGYFTDYGEAANPVGSHVGDFKWSNQAGDTVTYTFENNSFTESSFVWYGRTGVKMGKASVQIDNQEPVVVDTYSDSLYSQVEIFRSDLLAPGTHTVTITVLGENNETSQDTYVSVDAFAIYPQDLDITAVEAAEMVNDSYVPSIAGDQLMFPALPDDVSLRIAESVPQEILSEDGKVLVSDKTRVVSFTLELSKNGETAQTKPFTVTITPLNQPIDQSNMTVTASSHEVQGGSSIPENVLDGDPSTIWHSEYVSGQNKLPQTLTFALGGVRNIYQLDYLPRQDGVLNSSITRYEIQVSMDGTKFTTVASGDWVSDLNLKSVQFEQTQAAFVRLVASGSTSNNPYVSCAEINIYEYPLMDETPVEVETGKTVSLSAPEGGTFTVMDETVATVSADGVVTGISSGSTYVVWENGEQASVFPVTVTEATVSADKSLLQKTYDQAKDLDTTGVTDSAKAYFEEALAEAKAVLEDANATQQQVNDALLKLFEAVHGLGLVQGDKTQLELLISVADEMMKDADKYVETNWQQLVDALAAAKKVMADGDAMEEDVQPTVDTLLNAILDQRYKADKAILEELVNKAEAMDLSLYTAESVQVFKTALKTANLVLADETLSEEDQDVVDKAVSMLNESIEALSLKEENENDSSNSGTTEEDSDSKPESEVPATGDSGNLLAVVLITISAACAVVWIRRKRIAE